MNQRKISTSSRDAKRRSDLKSGDCFARPPLAGKLAMTVSLCFFMSLIHSAEVGAEQSVRTKITILLASNEEGEVDLVNDEYRDQLINLFSYKSYREWDVQAVELKKAERVKVPLPEGYELMLTYQGVENNKVMVQALIRKEGTQYVFTVLAMDPQGAVFLGGPPVIGSAGEAEGVGPAKKGVLIIVVETGF